MSFSASQYDVDLRPDPAYTNDYQEGLILVGGPNPYSKNHRYRTLGNFNNDHHPYPGGVRGTHGIFTAVDGTQVNILSEALWVPGTVDAGSFLFFSWYTAATAINVDCTA